MGYQYYVGCDACLIRTGTSTKPPVKEKVMTIISNVPTRTGCFGKMVFIVQIIIYDASLLIIVVVIMKKVVVIQPKKKHKLIHQMHTTLIIVSFVLSPLLLLA